MAKRFKLNASQIRPLVQSLGSCFASDHITIDGKCVGYMYREAPDSSVDSGWRFFSGAESQGFADNPENFALYDVNTIANYDPSILPFLGEPPGSAWSRDSSGAFIRESLPIDPELPITHISNDFR
jgi:hypothetical protein